MSSPFSHLLSRPNNKDTRNEIIHLVGNNSELFDELINLFINGTSRVSQTLSWAIGVIGEEQPHLITPHHQTLVGLLSDSTKHNAVRRNIVRIYQTCEIPEEIEGKLYELSLSFILENKEAIAVRAFSMKICERIAKRYPELIPELMDSIESVLPGASSGLKNRGKHTLDHLRKAISAQ